MDPHKNFSYSLITVAPSPAASGTTLEVQDVSVFPATPGFNITIWPTGQQPLSSNAEIARVTGIAGSQFTITRAQEGSSARTVLVGDQVALTITAKLLTDIEAAIPSTAGLLSNIKVSAGTLSAFRSDLTFQNSNGVSFGLNTNGVLTGTVATNYQSPGAYLTTAALSQDSSKYAGTNGAITGGSITVNTSGVSVSLPAYLTTAMGSNRGSDFVQATASFAGTNASGTIASGGISVSVAAPGAANFNISAGTTSNNTTAVRFQDSNGVSFGLNAGTITATVKTDYQTAGAYLTTAMASNAVTLSNIRVSAGTTSNLLSRLTFADGGGVSFGIGASTITATVRTDYQSAGAYLTTAMQSNRGSDFVQATAGFNGTNASGTIASNNISVSVAAQTVQTQNLIAASLSGNTSGVLALVSSGTFILAGGNNITLSQNGQSVTISGANAGGAQTAISGVVVSDTTYTSGTVSFSNQANITIGSSVNGGTQYIRLSGNPAQTVQTQNLHNVTLSGNTAGVMAQVSSGTMTLAGGNNITLSQNGNAITISGANAGGAQTGISGVIVSDATYTSGTISFSNQGNVTIGSSVNGATQYVRLSVAAQTNQSVGLYASSNTYLTSSGTVDARSLSFRGDKSITIGVSAGEVLFSVGAYLTTAMQSNRGSDFVQATAGFNGTNASGTIASNSISVSVAAPISIATTVNPVASANSTGTVTRYAPEDHQHAGVAAYAITNTGNTLGNTRSQVGTLYLAASGAITASQSTAAVGNDTVWLSVAAQSAQTQSLIAGIYDGANSISTGTIRLTNANGVSFSINGQTLSGSVATTYLASNASTNYVQANAAFNGTNATGTIASNAISVSVAAPIPIATAVKAVASIGSTGTITRYAPEDHQHVGVAAYAVTNTGNTLGNTRSHVGTFYIAASGAITASQSTAAGSDTIWLSVAAQTNQSLGLYMSSNTTSSVSSGTVDARSLTFRGMGIASVGYSAGEVIVSVPAGGGGLSNIRVSAGTTSNLLSDLTFADGNGISFGIDASTITASANTVGTATTGYSVASANSVGTVTRWAAEDHRHAGVGGIGISTAGNSAGTSGSQLGTYWLQGGNNITISQITSNNGSHTAVISGATLPVLATLSAWPDVLPGSTAVSTYYSASTSQGGGGGSTRTGYTFSLYAVPMPLPAALAFSEIRVGVSNQSVAGTGSATHMFSLGIYSNNASTLSLVAPFYGGIVVSQNSQTAQTYSVFTATTAGATSGAGGGMAGISKHSIYSSQGNLSANSQIYGRLQFIRVDSGAASTLSAGQYYLVFGNATASSGANVLSNVGILQSNAIHSQAIPDIGRENSTQTSNYLPAWGAISTTFSSNSNAAQFFPLPDAIAISNMTLSQSSAQRFHFPVMRNHL